MRLIGQIFGVGVAQMVVLASSVALASPGIVPYDATQVGDTRDHPRGLFKRDAYTCYGSHANVTDCQAALDQLQLLGDQNFEVFPGICLNWAQDTCNVRFCAQPYVTTNVNRTASWIYHWANTTLMDCVRGGKYATMGDTPNLNGNGGVYRVHLEHAKPRRG